MSDVQTWILSKKTVSKSIGRHFSSWKVRHFQLDVDLGLLVVKSPTRSKPVTIDLRSATVLRNHYAKRGLNDHDVYFLSVQHGELEFVLQFNNIDELNNWETSMKNATKLQMSFTQNANKQALDALSNFIRDRAMLQVDSLLYALIPR